ncbi:MAG TPA: PIN domain-containing protein [Candidatus Limnocylindria bacterium]|nr:PIN domain-containing protein [Candidatus Limnocylindria bacterium]
MNTAWLDANVLIRVLTDQPADLARKAQTLLGRAQKGDLLLVLSVVVVAEVVWVLGRHYGYDRSRIALGLRELVTADGIAAEGADDVLDALALMVDHNVDFPDAYLAAAANRRGDLVATFDTDFRKLGARIVAL